MSHHIRPLPNTYPEGWWHRQVASNQYGQSDRTHRNWGPDTLDGTLSEDEMQKNRRDPSVDVVKARYRDDPYYFANQFQLENIEVPLLSVANWVSWPYLLKSN